MNEQEFIEMQCRAQLETTVKLYFAWLQDVTGCPVEKEIEKMSAVSLSTHAHMIQIPSSNHSLAL